MSERSATPGTPSGIPPEHGGAGGTWVGPDAPHVMRRRRVANPDDPPVAPPLDDVRERPASPDSYFLGRMAIVQSQVYIVGVILVLQLWLITTALYELLSGRPQSLWGLTIASGVGFVVALVVALWARRRGRPL
jgi:hypothetical protein